MTDIESAKCNSSRSDNREAKPVHSFTGHYVKAPEVRAVRHVAAIPHAIDRSVRHVNIGHDGGSRHEPYARK